MKKLLSILAVVALLGTHAFGAMVGKGTREIKVGGMLDETVDENFRLHASGGYYVMDYVEVGARAGVEWLEGGDNQAMRAGVFGQYDLIHRPVEVMPFIGAGVGIVHSDVSTAALNRTETAFELVGFGGGKYYFLDNLAISGELQLMLATEDIYVEDRNKMEAFDWAITLSTRFFF